MDICIPGPVMEKIKSLSLSLSLYTPYKYRDSLCTPSRIYFHIFLPIVVVVIAHRIALESESVIERKKVFV